MAEPAKSAFGRVWDWVGHASVVQWLLGIAFTVAGLVGRHMKAGDATAYMYMGSAFFLTLAIGSGCVRLWNRWHPPTLVAVPRGGESVSVEVCPSIDSEFYGLGWFTDQYARRKRAFKLNWDNGSTFRRIRDGDKASFHLATLSTEDRYNPKLTLLGDGGILQQLSTKEEILLNGMLKEPSAWIDVMIEIRCKAHPHIWRMKYTFRLSAEWRFQVN
jgi:hypothetical protein